MDTITATFRIETPLDLRQAAEIIVGEQSTGTFMRLAGETDEIRKACRGEVIAIEKLSDSETPSLDSAFLDRRSTCGPYRTGRIKLSFPLANVGDSLPTLLATLAGNVFELGQLTAISLEDFDIPSGVGSGLNSSRDGIAATRNAVKIASRPVFGTIIKPNVGLKAPEIASVVAELAQAGVDFIKDDEVMGNPSFCTVADRFGAISDVLNAYRDKTGRQVLYAFNVSGSYDQMRRDIDLLSGFSGSVVMLSLNWVGHSSVQSLRAHTDLPIHGHRNGYASAVRSPDVGIRQAAYAKFWRLAGVDQLHVNGLQSKFWEPDECVLTSARACGVEMAGVGPMMPVFSSGQWAGTLTRTAQALASGDFMFLCGGGIIGHPDGIAAGVESVHQAWDAFENNIPVAEQKMGNTALRHAFEAFGAL